MKRSRLLETDSYQRTLLRCKNVMNSVWLILYKVSQKWMFSLRHSKHTVKKFAAIFGRKQCRWRFWSKLLQILYSWQNFLHCLKPIILRFNAKALLMNHNNYFFFISLMKRFAKTNTQLATRLMFKWKFSVYRKN